MPDTTIKRLKELVGHYEDSMLKVSKANVMDPDVRTHIKIIRNETLKEMITLIKRLS